MMMYQVFPRAMTREGTLKAAEAHLEEIAALGTDVVYLCPVFVSDADEDRTYWSARQGLVEFQNPCNPYRMKDYFHVDPEYGDDAALHSFVEKTHALGMKIMLDLVYFHCGPKAVFLQEHPDYIVRDEQGEPAVGEWRFPVLNYKNPALCEYMYSNMLYFIKEYGVDGYRCDVGDRVPEFFWKEGIRRCRELRPDFLMLNEGRTEPVKNAGFDWFYGFEWTAAYRDMFLKGSGAEALQKAHEQYAGGYTYLRALTNHDYTNDVYDRRYDREASSECVDLAFVVNALIDGVYFIYNGDEVCDDHRHNIFYSRFHNAGLDCTVNWTLAGSEAAVRRRALITEMACLRRNEPFASGEMLWQEAQGSRLAFKRTLNGKTACVMVNFGSEAQSWTLDRAAGAVLAQRSAALDGAQVTLDAYGFAVVMLSE